MAREADVIIVGAGLSGLIAARDVLAAGYEPLILEADRRVGGRILTEDVEGVPIELGAQWIGDTHHRMEALASELGVGIYPQFEDGETSYEFAGEVLRERAFYARYAGELGGVERVSPAAVAWPPPDARSSWPYRPRWRDGSCTTLRCPACAISSPSGCRTPRRTRCSRSTTSRSGVPTA
jgi:phytoene dehydrogenase-like protein